MLLAFDIDVHCLSALCSLSKPVYSSLFRPRLMPCVVNVKQSLKRQCTASQAQFVQAPLRCTESILGKRSLQKRMGQGARYFSHSTTNQTTHNKKRLESSLMVIGYPNVERQPKRWQLIAVPVGVVALALYKMNAEQKEAARIEFAQKPAGKNDLEIAAIAESTREDESPTVKTAIKEIEASQTTQDQSWNWKHFVIGFPIGAGLWLLIKASSGQ
jgi:hypothetical protein